MNDAKNEDLDKRFDVLLNAAIEGKLSDEAQDEFKDKYFDTGDPATAFKYLTVAADRGYVFAYYRLAEAYLKGKGCLKSDEMALHYSKLSVQNQLFGYILIGDCYRLGKGTDKDYDKAWEAYENANRSGEERDDDGPSSEELLLIAEHFPSIDKKMIEIDWLKYALKKQAKAIPPCMYHNIASSYFPRQSDEYIYWLKLGVAAGDIGAKCSLVDVTKDEAEKEKLIREILTSENFWDNYDAVADLAKSVIDDKKFEELAVRFLWEADEDTKWLFDHYREQDRENDLASILSVIDDDFVDSHPEDKH